MIYQMTTVGFDNMLILVIFGVIILIVGIYTLYTVRSMKKTKTPPGWLLSATDKENLKKPEEFCVEIRNCTLFLGIGCVAYGVFSVAEYLFLGIYMAKIIGVFAIIAVIAVFYVIFSRKKNKFIY